MLETFRTEFSWTAPEQGREDHFRAFGDLLQRIEIIPESGSPPDPDDSAYLIDLVRHLGLEELPPTLSPPEDSIGLYASTLCETMREALAVWVTEVCPRFDGRSDCILLAAIHFDVDAAGALLVDSVAIDNDARPVLVPDRLKQELFCLLGGQGGMAGLSGPGRPDRPTRAGRAYRSTGRCRRDRTCGSNWPARRHWPHWADRALRRRRARSNWPDRSWLAGPPAQQAKLDRQARAARLARR